MTYYLAANDRTLAILRSDGFVMTLTLKKRPWSKGFTKPQAAVELMSLLGNRSERKLDRFDNLDTVLRLDARLSSLFFNEPPQQVPIAHAMFFSLDSTSVENWLRKVFGSYRDCLPPIVSSLQQELENWTGLRWKTNKDIPIPGDLLEQAELTKQTHIGIWDFVAERQEQLKAQGAMR